MPTRTRGAAKVIIKADTNWFKNQITAGNLISVGAIAVSVASFYFSTNSTLDVQAKSIAEIKQKLVESDRKDEKQQAAVISERNSLRSEMTSRAEKTAEGIAELSKQTAVLSTQLIGIRDDLVKVGAQLTSLAATKRN